MYRPTAPEATRKFLDLAECHEPRELGNEKELLFDVVTVDRKMRKITVTRIGSGEDRIVEY